MIGSLNKPLTLVSQHANTHKNAGKPGTNVQSVQLPLECFLFLSSFLSLKNKQLPETLLILNISQFSLTGVNAEDSFSSELNPQSTEDGRYWCCTPAMLMVFKPFFFPHDCLNH